ncbi:MAG: hypothetical protein KAH20_13645 [Methylococcales bacterium]|nr:hypothetical protein [Methylococcales bacterium]
MKKILFGMLFSLITIQANAATVNITGSGLGFFNEAIINVGDTFSETHTLILGAGYDDYLLNVSGVDNPFGSIVDFDVLVDGISFLDSPVTLVPGTYNIQFLGVASVINSGGSLIVNAIGIPVSAVPIPAAVWLFGSALMGLVSVSKRKRTSISG